MSSWAIVAIMAMLIWGVVSMTRAKAGIVRDKYGNQSLAPRDDGAAQAALDAARREIDELRERIHVLERIATDANSGDAREQARIAAEIEALRTIPAQKKEPSE
ncbi:hypothetical protein [Erythrobacter colymbi]|uniref:hypothetical protein n=1 Tax=Erythrobacter colymbi TaxID=1161202 RepID=UPI000A37BF4F|nr:hypothetical protein [Erythrobacter colymbi]